MESICGCSDSSRLTVAVRGSMNGHEEVVAALLNAKSQAGRLGDDLGTLTVTQRRLES